MKAGGCRPPPEDPAPHLEFFHKLGYSTAQVHDVLLKFGPETDTDKLLGELIRTGPGSEPPRGPVAAVSAPPPPGGSRPATPESPVTSPSGEELREEDGALRPIVIDGSNVAMSHGNKEVFSCRGIQLAVNFFLQRGHSKITVFVPSWRKEQPRPDVPIADQRILRELEKKKLLVFTPSRRVGGKRVVCNDDIFIVQLAYESDGIVVSNDMYRDLQLSRPEWKRFIEERLLMFSFADDKFMPPEDPLGRHGPTLENFLRRCPKSPRRQPCPYGKKCTFGLKCRFLHPEREKGPARRQASPGRTQSLLVEDLARKLTLGREKDLRAESAAQTKAAPPGRRSSSRKEKVGSGSPQKPKEPDSGFWSEEGQPLSLSPSGGCQQSFNSHPWPAGAAHNLLLTSGVSSYPGAAHNLLLTSGVTSYPGTGRTFIQPAGAAHQARYRSEPPPGWPEPHAGGKEKEALRKKLKAIFNGQLVDAAMERRPHETDPQVLAEEILMLRSQNRR